LDHGEEVGGELVVAGSDAAEVLQLREEALDQVALAVEALAEAGVPAPVALGRVVGRGAALVGPAPFTDLQAMIGKAETALAAFVPEEIDDCAGKPLDLQIGPRRLTFTSETFILSFSLPNFHFHAVTAYNILRSRGVPLGKRDYEGRLRTSSEPKFGL
jgi:uncharacterized protein